MMKIKNGVIFNVVNTPDGYDLYRLIDGKLELIETGIANDDDLNKIIEEEA